MKKIKSISAIFLAALLAFTALPFSVNAAEVKNGICGDNLTWSLDSDGTLTVSGTGPMYNYGILSDISPFLTDSSIKVINVEDGVTEIGNFSFMNCYNMTKVTLPDSVTTIGSDSFSGCLI